MNLYYNPVHQRLIARLPKPLRRFYRNRYITELTVQVLVNEANRAQQANGSKVRDGRKTA